MKENDEAKKKFNIKNVLYITIGFILVIISSIFIIGEYNKSFIEKYVEKTYPNYIIKDKSYLYLDGFWSTYYDTEEDDLSLEILCNTMLEDKNTGLKVSVPFYHSKYGPFKDNKYGRKNIKEIVKEYEEYWKTINKIKKIYDIEINVSNAEITESDSCDIYEITLYLQYKENVDFKEVIREINSIKTNLYIENINYVIAKQDIYEKLKPWDESNININISSSTGIAINMQEIKDENEEDFDLYIEAYKNEDNKIEKFYTELYINKK